jgi:imidazole glycerol-phosphate synthase subunit HisH
VIALIDYKAGNLTSVKKALATLGAEVVVPTAPEQIGDAAGVIVPGVGHFGATRTLDRSWVDAILARVGEGRPLLGICLGMQWLFEGSDEAPDLQGLGLLAGRCYKLPSGSVKVPHVGWNSLSIAPDGASILDGVADGSQVYFTHSYVAPVSGDTAAVTEHGAPFASVAQRGYIAGLQFHPEKSGEVGLRILRNFLELAG